MKSIEKINLISRFPISRYYNFILKSPDVMTDYETIRLIREEHKSIARYGDGEIELMLGYSIAFQEKSPKLAKRLKEIAENSNENLLVCIPDVFGSKNELMSKYKRKDVIWWIRNNFFLKGYWKKFFGKQKYGNAFISRFYMIYKKRTDLEKYIEELKSLWKNRSLVLVEGAETNLGDGNDLFESAKSVKKIICPSKNAFDAYDYIYKEVVAKTDCNDLIIISLGPTATVLASDLSKTNRQALDLGHFDVEYMWYKMGATEKVKIDGKAVNEAK